MRLVFAKGKQKELINNFRKINNLSWKELSKLLNVKVGKIKAYFDEASLVSDSIYFMLDENRIYEKFILEKKEDNWGRIKGGVNSLGKTKEINIPKESKELSEFYGIMLGDGNSHRTKGYKKGTYMIRIVGDDIKDKAYLNDYVKSLIESLFNIKVKIGFFKNTHAMFLQAHSLRLIDFLEEKGFTPGNKIKNKLEIPLWIKNNRQYLIACLRGLYDTDGSVYKLTNQNSYQICFTNYNTDLLEDVREGLISLEISPSRIMKGTEIVITKKSELRKFLKVIGFHNERHLKKVKMWKL